MQAKAARGGSSTNQVVKRSHDATFSKVVDGRKQPIRGLWVRNERYYAQITVEDIQTREKGVRRVPLIGSSGEPVNTVAQAVAEINRLRTQRADETLPKFGRTPTFFAYANEYLAYIKSGVGTKRPGTIAKEESILRQWQTHLGHLRLDKIKPVHVSSFIRRRLQSDISKRTVKLDIIALRNVLKRALEIDQHLKSLPIPLGLNKELKSATPKRPLFTHEALEKLCAAAFDTKNNKEGLEVPVTKNAQEFVEYVRLLAYSGARRNEGLVLRWQDVDFDREQLTIGASGDTKNQTARVVDFNPKLKAHLKEMAKRCPSDSQWLFPSPQRGKRDIHVQSFRESLSMARGKAGLPKIGFHDLRHYFISYCVMSGIDYMTIAKWVGHRDGGILIGKVYGHLADDHAKAQAMRVKFGPVTNQN
jgi:integrase